MNCTVVIWRWHDRIGAKVCEGAPKDDNVPLRVNLTSCHYGISAAWSLSRFTRSTLSSLTLPGSSVLWCTIPPRPSVLFLVMIICCRLIIFQKMCDPCSCAAEKAICKIGVTTLNAGVHSLQRLPKRYIVTAVSNSVPRNVVKQAIPKSLYRY